METGGVRHEETHCREEKEKLCELKSIFSRNNGLFAPSHVAREKSP